VYRACTDDILRDWSGRQRAAILEPHYRAPARDQWLDLARHPRVLDAVQQALGLNEIILLTSQLQVKLPGDSRRLDWHQDRTYWPSVRGSDILTACLALEDADEGNACLQVIPLTHPGYSALAQGSRSVNEPVRVSVKPTPAMQEAAEPVCLRAGDVSLHGPDVIHGAGPNPGTRRRILYSMRFANALSVCVDLARHRKPVYYVRGDGEGLQDGYIDARPGRPLSGHGAESSVA
jgi:ectoine hydroxylase-related dioxygenase (phytanoyl-CoA dioxygenase family)